MAKQFRVDTLLMSGKNVSINPSDTTSHLRHDGTWDTTTTTSAKTGVIDSIFLRNPLTGNVPPNSLRFVPYVTTTNSTGFATTFGVGFSLYRNDYNTTTTSANGSFSLFSDNLSNTTELYLSRFTGQTGNQAGGSWSPWIKLWTENNLNTGQFATNSGLSGILSNWALNNVGNACLNTTNSGATIGVLGGGGALPSRWNYANGTSNLGFTLVETGIESGFSYLDIRISGLSAATTTIGLYPAYNPPIPALSGDSWSSNFDAKMISGTGIQLFNLLVERGAAPSLTFITSSQSSPSVLVSGEDYTTISHNRTLTNTGTVNISFQIFNSVVSGQTYDSIFRVRKISLRKSSWENVFVPTSGTGAYPITGQFLTVGMTGIYYPATNPSGYVSSSNTGILVGKNETGILVGKNQTGVLTDSFPTHSQTGTLLVGKNQTGILVGKNETGIFTNTFPTHTQTGTLLVGNNQTGILVGKNETGIYTNTFPTHTQTGSLLVGKNQTGNFVNIIDSRALVFQSTVTVGDSTAGTYKGNISLNSNNDGFPILAIRSGTSTRSQLIYTLSTDDLYIDVPRFTTWRNAVNGGAEAMQLNGTNGNLVVSGSITSAGSSVITSSNTGIYTNTFPTHTQTGNLLVGHNQTGVLADSFPTHAQTGTLLVGKNQTGSFLTSAVTSAIGTSNQVNVSAATGAVTFSLPQSIATSSQPSFASLFIKDFRATGDLTGSFAGGYNSNSNTPVWVELTEMLASTGYLGSSERLVIDLVGGFYTAIGYTRYIIHSRGGLSVRKFIYGEDVALHELKIYVDSGKSVTDVDRYKVGFNLGSGSQFHTTTIRAWETQKLKYCSVITAANPTGLTGWGDVTPAISSGDIGVGIINSTRGNFTQGAYDNGIRLLTTGQTGDFVNTTESRKLTLSGTFNNQLEVGMSGRAGAIRFNRGTDGLATTSIGWTGANEGTIFQISNESNAGEIRLNPSHASNNGFTTIYSANVETLRARNGRLGILNSNPSYSLDVSGSGNFTNGVYDSGVRLVTVNQTGTLLVGHNQTGVLTSSFPTHAQTGTLLVGKNHTGNFLFNNMGGNVLFNGTLSINTPDATVFTCYPGISYWLSSENQKRMIDFSGNANGNHFGAPLISGFYIDATGLSLNGSPIITSVANIVYTTGNQTISGNKTFASSIVAPSIQSNLGGGGLIDLDAAKLWDNSNPAIALDWSNRQLLDSTEALSVDWGNRKLTGTWSIEKLYIKEVQITGNGGGGGIVNAASNLGTGSGVYASLTTDTLNFKSLTNGNGIRINGTSNELSIGVNMTSVSSVLASEVILETGIGGVSVWADLTTASLSSGTWMVTAQVHGGHVDSHINIIGRLLIDSTIHSTSAASTFNDGSAVSGYVTIPLNAIITTTTTKTLKLQAGSDAFGPYILPKPYVGGTGANAEATRLIAIKIA